MVAAAVPLAAGDVILVYAAVKVLCRCCVALA